jgi:hypothetical protein
MRRRPLIISAYESFALRAKPSYAKQELLSFLVHLFAQRFAAIKNFPTTGGKLQLEEVFWHRRFTQWLRKLG